MQLAERAAYHSKERHDDTEEDRIGQHSKDSLSKFTLGGYKEYHILPHKRKDESNEELQRPICQHKFREEQKSCLNGYPRPPNDICDLFTEF